jgi:hypothetical protein
VQPFTDVQAELPGTNYNTEMGLYAGFDAPVVDNTCASGLRYVSQSYTRGAVGVSDGHKGER